MTTPRAQATLRVLVVDDEQPALDELAYLLSADERIGDVVAVSTATEGLRILRETDVDAVFLDIQMPGLSGLELAEVLGRFKEPPPVVFVTAHEQHAVDAFELDAVDYVLKPVRADRIAEAVRRVEAQAAGVAGGGRGGRAATGARPAQIAVERGGVTRFIDRDSISYVEAHGDYARLHTSAGDAYLVRIPLSSLEDDWRSAGFHRIHRSLLVALTHIDELRTEGGRCTVLVGDTELPVARRHTRELRDVLVRRARARE